MSDTSREVVGVFCGAAVLAATVSATLWMRSTNRKRREQRTIKEALHALRSRDIDEQSVAAEFLSAQLGAAGGPGDRMCAALLSEEDEEEVGSGIRLLCGLLTDDAVRIDAKRAAASTLRHALARAATRARAIFTSGSALPLVRDLVLSLASFVVRSPPPPAPPPSDAIEALRLSCWPLLVEPLSSQLATSSSSIEWTEVSEERLSGVQLESLDRLWVCPASVETAPARLETAISALQALHRRFGKELLARIALLLASEDGHLRTVCLELAVDFLRLPDSRAAAATTGLVRALLAIVGGEGFSRSTRVLALRGLKHSVFGCPGNARAAREANGVECLARIIQENGCEEEDKGRSLAIHAVLALEGLTEDPGCVSEMRERGIGLLISGLVSASTSDDPDDAQLLWARSAQSVLLATSGFLGSPASERF